MCKYASHPQSHITIQLGAWLALVTIGECQGHPHQGSRLHHATRDPHALLLLWSYVWACLIICFLKHKQKSRTDFAFSCPVVSEWSPLLSICLHIFKSKLFRFNSHMHVILLLNFKNVFLDIAIWAISEFAFSI